MIKAEQEKGHEKDKSQRAGGRVGERSEMKKVKPKRRRTEVEMTAERKDCNI